MITKSITAFFILLLIVSIFVSCSKDDNPVGANSKDNNSISALIGTWTLTLRKADGVVMTSDHSYWEVNPIDIIVLNADKTGTESRSSLAVTDTIVNWYLEGDYLVFSMLGQSGELGSPYELLGDTLAIFYPGFPGDAHNPPTPELEYDYIKK